MATPSKVAAITTPKNTMATPTQVTPSPRPASSAVIARPFSHKSPAMKTPASAHSHSHNVSTSSHPSSTPLPLPGLSEDLIALSSPAAALMASMGSHGLTPQPSGNDGLGISNGLPTKHIRSGSVNSTRNLEEERSRQVDEIQSRLRRRLIGRGISRDCVEQVAKEVGFEYLWDDDVFTIAGKCIELEVTFSNDDKDHVEDVSLKTNTDGIGHHDEDGSAVLKADLADPDRDVGKLPWTSLQSFASNLERLARLDHLSSGINCFDAINGLNYSFQRIWEAEKKRLGEKRSRRMLCDAILGQPVLNKKRQLGLSIDYWVDGYSANDTGEPHSSEAPAVGADVVESPMLLSESQELTHTATIGCETGYPSLRVAKDWVAEDVYADDEMVMRENNDDTTTHLSLVQINWLDPPPSLITIPETKDSSDAMMIDGTGINIPKPPEIRFTFILEHPLLIPVSVMPALTTRGLTISVDSQKVVSHHQALSSLSIAYRDPPDDMQPGNINAENRKSSVLEFLRSFETFEEDGEAQQAQHRYMAHSASQLWFYPLQIMSFEHPRQLTDLFPVLRQYALLWSTLRRLIQHASQKQKSADPVGSAAPRTTVMPKSKTVQRKSNRKPQEATLNSLLGTKSPTSMRTDPSLPAHNLDPVTSVDVCLSLTSSNPARPQLDLIVPLLGASTSSAKQPRTQFMTICVDIHPNGVFAIPSATGLPLFETELFIRKMEKVLEISGDIGVLVQWIMRRAQRTATR